MHNHTSWVSKQEEVKETQEANRNSDSIVRIFLVILLAWPQETLFCSQAELGPWTLFLLKYVPQTPPFMPMRALSEGWESSSHFGSLLATLVHIDLEEKNNIKGKVEFS